MRCGIVSSSTLAKYGRWDAGFYLGDPASLADAVARAEKRLEDARAAVERARQARQDEEQRVADLVKSGEMTPWPPQQEQEHADLSVQTDGGDQLPDRSPL